MDYISSPDETYSVVGDDVSSTNSFYRFKYPDQYKTTIFIHKFNKDYEAVYNGGNLVSGTGSGNEIVYTFVNAFPLNLSSIPVSYDQSQILKATVSFSYDRYFVERSGSKPVQADQGEPSPTNQAIAATPQESEEAYYNRIYSDL